MTNPDNPQFSEADVPEKVKLSQARLDIAGHILTNCLPQGFYQLHVDGCTITREYVDRDPLQGNEQSFWRTAFRWKSDEYLFVDYIPTTKDGKITTAEARSVNEKLEEGVSTSLPFPVATIGYHSNRFVQDYGVPIDEVLMSRTFTDARFNLYAYPPDDKNIIRQNQLRLRWGYPKDKNSDDTIGPIGPLHSIGYGYRYIPYSPAIMDERIISENKMDLSWVYMRNIKKSPPIIGTQHIFFSEQIDRLNSTEVNINIAGRSCMVDAVAISSEPHPLKNSDPITSMHVTPMAFNIPLDIVDPEFFLSQIEYIAKAME